MIILDDYHWAIAFNQGGQHYVPINDTDPQSFDEQCDDETSDAEQFDDGDAKYDMSVEDALDTEPRDT